MTYTELPPFELAFPGPLRDELVAAVLSGAKTSTTGLLIQYECDGEALPQVGERSALVDSSGAPVAVLETTDVRLVPLGEIDLAHAADEGEGYETVEAWRVAHEGFWHSAAMRDSLKMPDFTVDDHTVGVTERFRVLSRVWPLAQVNTAFAEEAAALTQALRAVAETELDRPTCCPPWTVKEEFAHTATAIARTLSLLDTAVPPGEPLSVASYYARFGPTASGERIADAQLHALKHTGAQLIDWFDSRWRQVQAHVADVAADSAIATRHGEPMLLSDYQATRVIELAVHGLDLTDALGREPWLTRAAAEVVEGVLFPSAGAAAREALGADPAALIRRATGRQPLTDLERAELQRRGITWLTLG